MAGKHINKNLGAICAEANQAQSIFDCVLSIDHLGTQGDETKKRY